MESLEDSNWYSLSDNFSLYERYMRSFNVVGHLVDGTNNREACEPSSSGSQQSSVSRDNIDLTVAPVDVTTKHCETAETECDIINLATYDNGVKKNFNLETDLVSKIDSSCNSLALSHDNSSATIDRSLLHDKSNHTDVHVSSEESKVDTCTQPMFITSTMENSNNAVDSVPLFRDVRPSESVFKLPTSELSFNGTIKHVKKLTPIVDPITALSSSTGLVSLDEKSAEAFTSSSETEDTKSNHRNFDISNDTNTYNRTEKTAGSTGDSQYDEFSSKNNVAANDEGVGKWNFDQSYSSLEASFDSGVRSPDMFSEDDDDEDGQSPESEPFWGFLKDYEAYDKRKVKKMEETLQGVLPPPSVTILRTDATEMLKKYYCYLPLFNENEKARTPEINSTTPKKLLSFVEIPEPVTLPGMLCDTGGSLKCGSSSETINTGGNLNTSSELNTSDKNVELKLSSEEEAAKTSWPDVLKCRYYDLYYNVTKYSEKFELLALRYGERYVGAETDTSVNVHSGGLQSPSSASKRKALRLKMAQVKSPGRRLSHLARRRQAFCSAATINEKAQSSGPKMVLIDKNFFPHRKLINSAERKSPRSRRTPGKRTPLRRTPGKKTPAKTPTTRSGGSSKKKAMRRLLMDPETLSRTQPTLATLKRALFISPDNKKIPQTSCSSVPAQAMKSKRALFGSPVRSAETKSLDGSQSDHFMKRKLYAMDDQPESSRSKIAKSLSFGGDSIGNSQSIGFIRRSSEVLAAKNSVELNETNKKKLLWAVSEALRVHGWRMSSPGFREKASSLARLTRRLLALPPHAAKLAAPKLSTSETMLKLARQYVFAIIQGRSVDDCLQEEQMKLANEANAKVTGYITAAAYQQVKARQVTGTLISQIKENNGCDFSIRQDIPKSGSKNVLQDKLVNIDTNSNSSSGLSIFDKSGVGLYISNSMPPFEEVAKSRARRQISFDDIDFPKR